MRGLVIGAAGILLLALASPALADFRVEKELGLAPGGRFVLDSDVGSVTVTGSRSSGVHVVITAKRDDIQDYIDIDFAEAPGEVRVTADKLKRISSWRSWFGWEKGHSLHFEIVVPSESDVEIETGGGSIRAGDIRGEVELQTSGGSIRANDIEGKLVGHTSGGSVGVERIAGDTRISTSGGSISAESIEGSLMAKTSGGTVTVEKVTGDLVARSSGGSIRIDGAGGHVEAKTSGGSVTTRFAAGNDRGGDLSSSGGGIYVTLDSGAGLEVDAHTSGGSVSCDLPVTVSGKLSRNSLRGTLGGGGELLRIRTSGGSIRIQSR